MSEQAAQAAVDQACRVLRLPTIRNQFPDLAAKAGNDQMSYLVFLAELLLAECDDRARRRSERRIKAAQCPRKAGAMALCHREEDDRRTCRVVWGCSNRPLWWKWADRPTAPLELCPYPDLMDG